MILLWWSADLRTDVVNWFIITLLIHLWGFICNSSCLSRVISHYFSVCLNSLHTQRVRKTKRWNICFKHLWFTFSSLAHFGVTCLFVLFLNRIWQTPSTQQRHGDGIPGAQPQPHPGGRSQGSSQRRDGAGTRSTWSRPEGLPSFREQQWTQHLVQQHPTWRCNRCQGEKETRGRSFNSQIKSWWLCVFIKASRLIDSWLICYKHHSSISGSVSLCCQRKMFTGFDWSQPLCLNVWI